jgi:hypothetical protein
MRGYVHEGPAIGAVSARLGSRTALPICRVVTELPVKCRGSAWTDAITYAQNVTCVNPFPEIFHALPHIDRDHLWRTVFGGDRVLPRAEAEIRENATVKPSCRFKLRDRNFAWRIIR